VLFALIVILLLLTYKQAGGELYCQVKAVTGIPCSSCGLTRDFLSFINLDFKSPINPNSIKLFGFVIIQALYRIGITTKLLKFKIANIKKTISLDILLTAIMAIVTLIQFW
jgi:hypothetical protein